MLIYINIKNIPFNFLCHAPYIHQLANFKSLSIRYCRGRSDHKVFVRMIMALQASQSISFLSVVNREVGNKSLT